MLDIYQQYKAKLRTPEQAVKAVTEGGAPARRPKIPEDESIKTPPSSAARMAKDDLIKQ